jgi:lysophospholipase L1-like esterase
MRRRAIARAARLVVVLLAVLFAAAAGARAVAGPGPAAARPTPATYLALGDSVPFGYRGSAPSYSDPTAFVGYPEKIAAERHLRLLNASCPGETTASFLDSQAPNNGCENSPPGFHYRGTFPLHVDYGTSQLRYAEQVLTADRSVGLVTLQVGANDAFLCQETTADHCTSPAEGLALIQQVSANLTTILQGLRGTGYRGPIVVVTYYALNYADVSGTQALDGAIAGAARAQGALVADGFAAFQGPAGRVGGDLTAAGLVLPADVHPTDQGQRLLADAVEAVLR